MHAKNEIPLCHELLGLNFSNKKMKSIGIPQGARKINRPFHKHANTGTIDAHPTHDNNTNAYHIVHVSVP